MFYVGGGCFERSDEVPAISVVRLGRFRIMGYELRLNFALDQLNWCLVLYESVRGEKR